MKSFVKDSKKCFIAMFILIVICEILIRVDNMFIQTLGICLVPFIVLFGFFLIKNDQKKLTK